jgi:ribulose-5-phosphate 4-epimerase/fuculose-1-phosphate aldolase
MTKETFMSIISADLKEEIVSYAKLAVACRLVINTQGNISARDPETGDIAITPHDVEYAEMTADDIVTVDVQGNQLDGRHDPSEEMRVHLSVYRHRPNVHAVVHTEPIFTNIFGVIGQPIDTVLVSLLVANKRAVPVMPFMPSGSDAFGEEMVRVMGDGNAVIWANHGLATVGATLKEAFRASVAVESAAEVLQSAKRLGDPVVLTYDQLGIA